MKRVSWCLGTAILPPTLDIRKGPSPPWHPTQGPLPTGQFQPSPHGQPGYPQGPNPYPQGGYPRAPTPWGLPPGPLHSPGGYP